MFKVNIPISAPIHNSAPLYFLPWKKKFEYFFIEKIKNTSTIHQS